MDVLADEIVRFLRATGPDHDPIQTEMAEYATAEGFPIIGPNAGAVLRLLARLTDAERIFEFGSGYGYSAYWFLQGMNPNGHIVLTEFDEDELAMGREFLDRADLVDRASFEAGDAMETIERYDGPFDVVLIDHQKHRYADAFERVRTDVRVGGVVVADNMMEGPIDFDRLLAHFENDEPLPAAESDRETAGIGQYVDTVRADPAFETFLLPVGSGISISTRVE